MNVRLFVIMSLIVIVFSGCGVPGSDGAAGTLRVKVVDRHGGNVSGAIVILGDSSGSLITTGVTSSVGEYRFTGPPADATVTVANSCVFSDPALYQQVTGTIRSITAAYDVNVTTVTLNVDNCDAGAIADLTVDIINLPSAAVYAYAAAGGEGYYSFGPVTGGQARVRMLVFSNSVQKDGKISVVATSTDSGNRPVSYGMLLDQTVASLMTVTVDAGNACSDSVQYLVTNIPASARNLDQSLALSRSGTKEFTVYPDSSVVSAATVTVTALTLPGYGDSFHYEVSAELDRNQNGLIDGWIDMGNMDIAVSAPSNQTFDLSRALAVPENLVISFASGTARAQVTWSGTDSSTDLVVGFVQYGIPGQGLSLDFTGASTRTTFIFPQLPDELAAFRPQEIMDVQIYNFSSTGLTGYNDLLNMLDRSPFSLYTTGAYNFSGGTVATGTEMKPHMSRSRMVRPGRTSMLPFIH